MHTSALFVEATIDAIFTNVIEKEIRLHFTSPWQPTTPIQIIATGVDDFVAHDMKLANIVERLTWHRPDATDILRERLFYLMQGRAPHAAELHWPALTTKYQRIANGELTFLEIVRVYGASLLILAANISIQVAIPDHPVTVD